MLLRVFAVSAVLTFGAAPHAWANASIVSTPPDTAPANTVSTVPDDSINDFLPEDVAISDCVSAAPKPGCGSKARGGWHQYLVAVALVGGLVFVGWRIVAGVRRVPAPR